MRHRLFRIIVHSRLCRYFKNVCTSAVLLYRTIAPQSVGILQLGVGNAFTLGKLCLIVDTCCYIDLCMGNDRVKMFPF